MTKDAEVVVVGGGILGFAVALTLQEQRPGISVIVLEKESSVAQHQTGHNSGVIHAGVYYKPGSHKAELCREGAQRMIDFCEENNIAYTQRGKLIVALNDGELARLSDLESRSIANGVPGIKRIGKDELQEIEPAARGIAALHSPSTAATNYAEVTKVMRSLVEKNGGKIFTDYNVSEITTELDHERVAAEDGRSLSADYVVVCAGLQSDRLLATRGRKSDIHIVPFRGTYFDLAERSASLVKSMIYPVPDPRFPFLGVHFTRHVDESVSVGPNAVLALAREKYERFGFSLTDMRDTFGFSGFWHMAKKYWKTGGTEVIDEWFLQRYINKARAYVPDANPADFHAGNIGIRAQAVRGNGALVDDFAFEHDGNALFVLNAPSPAATASFAIARHIVQTLLLPVRPKRVRKPAGSKGGSVKDSASTTLKPSKEKATNGTRTKRPRAAKPSSNK